MLTRDDFKERLVLVTSLALQKAKRRRMTWFRLVLHTQRALKDFFVEMAREGHLTVPWLPEPAHPLELVDLVILEDTGEEVNINITPLMSRLYPPEMAYMFPVSAGRKKPPPPPEGGGRYVDAD